MNNLGKKSYMIPDDFCFVLTDDREKVRNEKIAKDKEGFDAIIMAEGKRILAGCDRITDKISTIEKELQK